MKMIPVWPEAPSSVPHQSGWEYIQVGLYWYIILGLADICRKMYSKHRANIYLLMHVLHVVQNASQVCA